MTATLMGWGERKEWGSGPRAGDPWEDGASFSALARPAGEAKGRAGYRLGRTRAGRLTQRQECVPYKDEVGGSNPSSPTRCTTTHSRARLRARAEKRSILDSAEG